MRNDDDVLRYLDDASALGLRVGLEFDLGVAAPLRPTTRDALHYVIGALHQIQLAPDEWIRFDDAGAFLKGRVKTFTAADRFRDPALAGRIRERMLEEVRIGIERDRIDILGHATMGPLAALGDPESAFPAEWQERLIRMCVEAGVAIEVNETYGVPHREMLERANALGARFSVGSDTHFALLPLDKTEAMIRAAGLSEERFLQGRRVRTPSAPG